MLDTKLKKKGFVRILQELSKTLQRIFQIVRMDCRKHGVIKQCSRIQSHEAINRGSAIDDFSFGADQENGVITVFDQSAETYLTVAQRVFRLFALGDVAQNTAQQKALVGLNWECQRLSCSKGPIRALDLSFY